MARESSKPFYYESYDKYRFFKAVSRCFLTFPNSIFTSLNIEVHLRQASNMHYGLDVRETKQLAYQYAIKNDIKIPENWKKSETAGTEGFYLFLNCTKLSNHTPEATSLSRTTSFNRSNVDTFFKNLDSVHKRYNFSADCI